MARHENGESMDQAIIEHIQSRLHKRAEIRRQIQSLESRVRERRRSSHSELIREIAKKAGVDGQGVQEIFDEAQRRLQAQHLITSKGYERIRSKSMAFVREESRRRRAIRKRYLELHGEKFKAREGNPELKFFAPVGHWFNSDATIRGLYGGGIDTGESAEEHTMVVDYDGTVGYHYFYPRAYVRTGDVEAPFVLEIYQTIVIRHAPLESGAGSFHVDSVRLDLSGVGHSRSRMGDTCAFERGHNWWDMGELSVEANAIQFDPESGLFMENIILNRRLHAGLGTHDSPVEIEEATWPAPVDIYLDNNESEIWIYLTLTTGASAADEDGFSEVNFSQTDTEGLQLGCVTLIGGYE